MKQLSKYQLLTAILLGVIALLGLVIMVTQQPPEPTVVTNTNAPLNSAVREELQRYFGYESLPIRYLSIPYDVTTNANEQGNFLDIGFLLLMFLPLLLLVGFQKQPWWRFGVMAICLLLFIISTGSSYMFGLKGERIGQNELPQYLESTSFSDAPTGVLTAKIYNVTTSIYQSIAEMFAGKEGYWTYPLVIGLFLAGFFLLNHRLKAESRTNTVVIYFLYFYVFLWAILAAGVIWYGFLFFPMGLILLFGMISKYQKEAILEKKWLARLAIGMTALWLMLAVANRISNIRPGAVTADTGKRLFDPAFVRYQMGKIGEQEIKEAFYPNVTTAFRMINQEDQSMIYRVGTMFPFFIKKNNRRLFSDNQLDFFQRVESKYPSKQQIINLLKASGFQYLIVDLQTPFIDHTPEQTLRKKFEKFMNFIYQNPNLELIATDRVLNVSQNQTPKYEYGVFGNIQQQGQYAIYKIK